MRVRPALLLTCLLVLLATVLPGQAVEPARPSLAAISNIQGIDYSNVFRPTAAILPDLPRLQSIGVNHVTLYVYLFVDSPTGSSVKRGPTTPSDAELALVIDRIHAAGMTVAVSPLPWSEDGTWRGTFLPDDRSAFFDSWRFWIAHYAELSEQQDVELFSIGSEQLTLQGEAEQWRKTAAVARDRFSGPLSYMATLPSASSVPFWDALDVVSVAPYFTVSDARQPTYDEVHGTWLGGMSQLRQLATETGKKVLIAETGFVNAEYFGRLTYDPSPSEVPAPLAQADAYAAVLDAIAGTPDRSSFLLGIAWWDWDPFSNSVAETTYSPRGKLAECVIAEKWGGAAVSSLAVLLPCGASRP